MRVLFVAGYSHPSYHRKIELLANNPNLELFHVTVDTLDRPSGRYPSANGEQSYQVQAFPGFVWGRPGDSHRTLLRTCDFGARHFVPDLIHVESDVETTGTAQVVLARLLAAPQSKLVLYSWQNVYRKRKAYVRWLVRFVLSNADHICCANQEAIEVLRAQNYTGDATVTPLAGCDRRYFYPPPAETVTPRRTALPLVVGYVGRLVPEKGVDTLLDAVARMPLSISLLIVGDGPLRPVLAAQAASLGLSERCKFVGHVPTGALREFMWQMDILVLPSRTTPQWKEQYGRVLIEAMGCRVAVVGSDSGAIPEVIGTAGFVFPEGDVTALAALLTRLVQNPALRLDAGERGLQLVEQRFTVECVSSRLLDVWLDVAASKPIQHGRAGTG
jgi:glycosyltransferase involved in cell wall biosynthesis